MSATSAPPSANINVTGGSHADLHTPWTHSLAAPQQSTLQASPLPVTAPGDDPNVAEQSPTPKRRALGEGAPSAQPSFELTSSFDASGVDGDNDTGTPGRGPRHWFVTPARSIAPVASGLPVELAAEQSAIIEAGAQVEKHFASTVFVVSAGAGSGKTFTIRKLIEALRMNGKYTRSEIVYAVFNKAAAVDARNSLNQLCLVSTLAAAACATLARSRNARAAIFELSGIDSFKALVDASTTSTFGRPEFAEYRALLTDDEASYLCGRFAPIVTVFIEDFMRARARASTSTSR